VSTNVTRQPRRDGRARARLDQRTTTLDHLLRRRTDTEEEFLFMNEDLKRVKAVLREKLGVSLDSKQGNLGSKETTMRLTFSWSGALRTYPKLLALATERRKS
jgi:hypothetical protein